MKAIAHSLLAFCAIVCLSPATAGTELGSLPPGEIARSSAGPSDELIGFLAFDPGIVAARIPPGLRLRTLAEMAHRWPRLADYLVKHPGRSGWAWSHFEIIGIHAAKYDAMDARFGPGHGGMAVWYAEVVRDDESDSRPLGDQNLALGSWVSDARLAAYMRARGFPATAARVQFRRDDASASGDLATADLAIHGECRLEGAPFVPWWGKDKLSYETIWTPAGEGETFEVVTWAGHRSRTCRDATWRVSGSHPFARLFNDAVSADASILPTEFAYGYDLRSALYARAAAAPAPENLYTRVEAKLAADPALAARLGKPGPEMDRVRWLLGEWNVVAEVQASRKATEPERGISRVTLQLGGTALQYQDTYPSGTQDMGFLLYSPATKSWVAIGLDSLGNAVTTIGDVQADRMVFEGDVLVLGVPTHLRQTFQREGADAYLLTNEERSAGRWIPLDTYRYTRR